MVLELWATRAGQDPSAAMIEGKKAGGVECIVYQKVQHSVSLVIGSSFIALTSETSLMKHSIELTGEKCFTGHRFQSKEVQGEH